MDLGLVGCLLRQLRSPLRLEQFWLFFCLSTALMYCSFMFLGCATCLLFLILSLPEGLCLKLELSLLSSIELLVFQLNLLQLGR